MTDEIKQLIAGLRFCAEHGYCRSYDKREECPGFRICICNENRDVMAVAADALEKLAADNKQLFALLQETTNQLVADRDHWKARCEAAEKDMKAMDDHWGERDYPCILCLKYHTAECVIGNTCFQWRGVQEGDTNGN